MTSSREIELTELLAKWLLFIKKRFLVLAVFVVAGIGIGYMKSRPAKTYFQTRVIVRSAFIDNQVMYWLVNKLQQCIDEGRSAQLAAELNISGEAAGQFINMKPELTSRNSALVTHAPVMTVNNKNHKDDFSAVAINLDIYDTSVIKEFKKGFTNYVIRHDNAKERADSFRKEKENLLSLINSRIADAENARKSGASAPDKDLIKLHEKKIKLENELKQIREIEFIGSEYFPQPVVSGFSKLFFSIYFLLFLLLGLGVALLLELRKPVSEKMKELSR